MIYALFLLSTLLFAKASTVEQDWEIFKDTYGKKYANAIEERTRFKNFVENFRAVSLRNMAEFLNNGTALHGVTQFSDLSQAEFEYGYLTDTSEELTTDQSSHNQQPVATMALVDWTGKYTTAVKDQGYCGSCWAFAATEQIESDTIRTLGLKYKLSPAQVTQCTTTASGCNGGLASKAYDYVKSVGGIETDANYPYTTDLYNGKTGTCAAKPSLFTTVTVSSYSDVVGESTMASYVQTKGPLSVHVDASNWNTYKTGIMTSCGTTTNHAVQAVGVETATGGYWKIRNSWSTSFGESGFIRLAYGKNVCAVASKSGQHVAVTKK